MFDGGALIGILKWVALALVPASALWGLLAPKSSREDADGRKHLTRAGGVTLALTLATAAVSALSFRLDSALKEEAEAKQARNEAVRKRFDMASSALTMINAVNSRTAVEKIDRAEADRRADVLDGQVAALSRETRERLRDLELAQTVATGARDNLARTGEALTQIERVLQPIEAMTVTVTWAIPGDTPGLKEATVFIAQDAKAAEIEEYRKWLAQPTHYRSAKFYPPSQFEVQLRDPYRGDNRSRAERNLSFAISEATVHVDFFAKRNLVVNSGDKQEIAGKLVFGRGDIHMSLKLSKPQRYMYERSSGALILSFRETIEPINMRQGDAIVSFTDLEKSFGIIRLSQTLFSRAWPLALEIKGKTRSYLFPRLEEIRRVEKRGALFVLPPLRASPPGTVVVRG